MVRCRRCPRLVEWREEVAADPPRRFAARGTGRGRCPASGTRGRVVIVSGWRPPPTAATAPGACSPATGPATGSTRRFTAPGSQTRPRSEHRDDGLRLRDAYVTAVNRCAPPGNRPTPTERDNCLPYLVEELRLLERASVVVALGSFAWDGALRALRALGQRDPASQAALRPRRRGGRRRLHADRLLPPVAAEHLHRQADRGDARRGVRSGPGAGSRGAERRRIRAPWS